MARAREFLLDALANDLSGIGSDRVAGAGTPPGKNLFLARSSELPAASCVKPSSISQDQQQQKHNAAREQKRHC